MARTIDTARLIARRFLRSPKSHSIINVMSWVSVVAVGVPVAAMVILMSVFNGFDAIVRGMHSDFEPEITVMPERGATMNLDKELQQRINGSSEVVASTWVLDGQALRQVIEQEKPDYIVPEVEAIATPELLKLEKEESGALEND